jgi:hypothetical protein
MMSGMPRNRSVYPAASARSGKKTGPRSVRIAAMTSESTSTQAAATSSTRMLSRNPSATRGSEASATSGLKNVCCTTGQPGVLMIAIQSSTAKTTVLPAPIRMDRTLC